MPQHKLLLVDDDQPILESLKDIFELADFDVITATNGKEALARLQSGRPDIIVSDVMMPEMDGYEFFDKVRENLDWKAIPFIFLSARGESNRIKDAYSLGADHYITKPFDPEELLVLVKSRLQRIQEIRDVLKRQFDRHTPQQRTAIESKSKKALELISSYLEIYQREREQLAPPRAEQLDLQVDKTLNRMLRLFEDLMLLVYIDSGAVQAEIQSLYQKLDLIEELNLVFEMLGTYAQERDVHLKPSMPEEATVYAHAHFVRDIFLRVIENAIKFSQPGGDVWIDVDSLKDNIKVTIRDEGMGISDQGLQSIYQYINNPERVKLEKQGGGLGLQIASRLIRLHGGEIQVKSTLGRGSTFTILLPVSLGEIP